MANRREGPSVDWKISIPLELAYKIELTFFDNSNRKPIYGARSQLITVLLQKYWDDLPQEIKDRALKPSAPPPMIGALK